MFMGFSLHFYIIFGTNLLTGGPARIAIFFCLFQCFEEKEYQMESKQNETFGSDLFWNKRDPGDLEWTSSNRGGGHEGARRAPWRWARPHPRGPLERPPTYFFLLYISMDPENIQEHHEKLFPPPKPSITARSHLGAFVGAPPDGGSTMECLYIISKASPMSCE